ncbi:GAF and ANTAR domain-containing protein [Actinomycetospora sp. TBRC 11914]|uniref:GAF and ANTAR domain-containing protein n=1 Tax=Actinomycetospora sp. TBRC 11914 TaxID=2729387 RepID=UPI00145DC5A8|nr:GAF and ANTAR domain-containing protein [Actinomycetospora sp. TBRC 11914]NMO94083.1 GAF and ANTAR domain-containing protein [Actinomycetospora sp. TBRC 11914]
MSANDDLLVSLTTSARALKSKRSIRDLEQTLAHIVEAAVQTVPGVAAGGISYTDDGAVASRHPTNTTVTELDHLQSTLREGPCITAILDPPPTGIVIADDLAGVDGERWPGFAPKAVERGYRSIMSTQLSSERSMRTALNLYAAEPGTFDTEAQITAGLFGTQAALLLYGTQQTLYLQEALESRDVIGAAKGILMERFSVDDDGAFRLLVNASQDTNIKLVEVAKWVHREVVDRSQAPPDDEFGLDGRR